MAKKIKIVELDIDVGALTEKAAQSRTQVQGLRDEIKQLKKVQRDAQKEIDNSTVSLDKLTKAGYGQSRAAQFLRDKIENSNNVIKDSNYILTQHESKLKSASREYNMNKNVLQAYSDKTLQHLDIIKQTNGSIDQISAALSKNKAVYKSLSAEERENAEIGGALLEIIQQQDEEYKELHKSIGNTQVEVGNYKEEVKAAIQESISFEPTLKSLLGPFSFLYSYIAVSTKALYSWATAQNVASKSTKGTSLALKLFRIALISTGIGAIVVVIGSLVAYLTQTQKGINAVNRVLVPLKVLFQSLLGVLQKVGENLADAFTNPKQAMKDLYDFVKNNLINRFKAFGVILEGIMELDFKKATNGALQVATGVEDVIGKTKKLAEETNEFMSEAIKRGQRIQEINEQLSRTEADFILRTAELKEQFKAQNKLAEDTTKSFAEREKAAKASISTLKEINALARERNNLEVERLKLQFESNDTSDADRAELASKIAELRAANAQMLKAETTQQNKLNTIRQSAANEAKKRAEDAKKRAEEVARKREEAYQRVLDAQQKAIDKAKTELDIYYQTNVGIAASLQERVNLEEKARNKRLAFLKEETELQIKQAKGNAAEINKIKADAKAEELSINRDFLQAQADLTTEHAEKELSLWIAQNKSKIENTNRLNDELVNAEQARLETIYNKKLANLEQEKQLLEEAGQFDYAKKLEYDQAKIEAEDEYQTAKSEVETTYAEQKAEDAKVKRAEEFEARLIALEEENATEFEFKQELAYQNFENEKIALKAQYEDNKLSYDNYQAALKNIRQEYANQINTIDEEVANHKLDVQKEVFNGIADLLGKESKLGKTAAILEIMINTFQKAQEAWNIASVLAANPLTAPLAPWAYAKSILIGVKGAATAGKIAGLGKKKAAKGITLSGPSHSNGGIDLYDAQGNHVIEAEGDENVYVLNKRASKEIAALSGLNQAFGGIPLTRTVNHAASGGMVSYNMATTGTSKATLDANVVAQQMAPLIAEAVANGAKVGTEIGAKIGTHSGAMVGIQEKRVNEQIARSASHG